VREARPDWRPQPRVRNPLLLALLKLDYDECELTGQTWGTHLHHVVFKVHGGDDVRANIVNLAEELHLRYHRADRQVMRQLALHVRDARPDTVRYLNHKVDGGFGPWFDRHMKGKP
jgi:hypothetical protein